MNYKPFENRKASRAAKRWFILSIIVLFVALTILTLDASYKKSEPLYRSTSMREVITKNDNVEKVLLTCYQLTNLFTSMLRSKLPFVGISMDNREAMIKEFSYFNGHELKDGSYEYDPFEENILSEIIRRGMFVNELELVLGHDWDELGYNSDLNEYFDAYAVDRIKHEAISFIFKATPFG